MSLYFKNSLFYSKKFVTLKVDKAVRNGISYSLKQMTRNKHMNMFTAIQLVVLMKILFYMFFLCSNHHFLTKSLKVILQIIILVFHYCLIFYLMIKLLMSVNYAEFQLAVGLFNKCLTYNMSQQFFPDITMRNAIRKITFAIKFLFICIFNVKIHVWLYTRTIDKRNPGPRPSPQNFSICHSNLNSITVHSYRKIFLLKADLSIHKFNII